MVCSAEQDPGTVTDFPKLAPIKLTVGEGWVQWGKTLPEGQTAKKMVDSRFPARYVGLQAHVSNSIGYYISIWT